MPEFYEDPQAIGTTQYHLLTLQIYNLVATDGVKAMCENLGCFWINEQIGGAIPRIIKGSVTMAFIQIIRNGSGGCEIRITDDIPANRIYFSRRIPFTDLKKDLRLYLQLGGPPTSPARPDRPSWVLMLPSEY